MQELVAAFGGAMNQQQVMQVYNSITASSFAADGQPTDTIAHAVNQAFMDGVLLRYPQDIERLSSASVQDVLPGVLLYFISSDQGRPLTLPTFARETSLESEYRIRRGI